MPQISLRIRAKFLLVACIFYELLTEQHFEILSLKGGCTGSSECTLGKISHCWKSHVMAHMNLPNLVVTLSCSRSAMDGCYFSVYDVCI